MTIGIQVDVPPVPSEARRVVGRVLHAVTETRVGTFRINVVQSRSKDDFDQLLAEGYEDSYASDLEWAESAIKVTVKESLVD